MYKHKHYKKSEGLFEYATSLIKADYDYFSGYLLFLVPLEVPEVPLG